MDRWLILLHVRRSPTRSIVDVGKLGKGLRVLPPHLICVEMAAGTSRGARGVVEANSQGQTSALNEKVSNTLSGIEIARSSQRAIIAAHDTHAIEHGSAADAPTREHRSAGRTPPGAGGRNGDFFATFGTEVEAFH